MTIAAILRYAGLFLSVAALAIWLVLGAHPGWTQTSVPVEKTDEVTGIVYQEYQQRFVPGVDFLGAAGIGALLLIGISFVFRKPSNKIRTQIS